MAKQSGKDGNKIDVYILSIGKDDSWKGTPLDLVEEGHLKAEPTTAATTNNADATVGSSIASPPLSKEELKPADKTNKMEDNLENNLSEGKRSGRSPFPRVCPPTQKELGAFRKPPLLPSAAEEGKSSSAEALSTNFNGLISSPLLSKMENGILGTEATSPQLSSPPPAVQLSAPTADGGSGNGARKELEDAIQRIEAHIKTEQAARRAAEGALAQARQQSQDTAITATQPPSFMPSVPTSSCAELQIALEDLANAQLAVQRAHALITYILSQQQQRQQTHHRTGSGKIQPDLSIKERDDISPVIRHSAPISPSVASPSLPLYESAGTGDLLSSPSTLTKATPLERSMSWVAGGPKEPSTKKNWTTPSLKVKTGPSNDSSLAGKIPGPSHRGGGAVRKTESNTLHSSPKTATPFASKRGGSSGMSPTRGGAGGRVDSPTATGWNNDRFATGKAEAFMLSQAARWNSK